MGNRLTVVVPTYNEEAMVGKCLAALRAQKNQKFDIMVVDGKSKDKTVEIAKKYANKVIFDQGKGTAAARNLAVKKIRSDVVAFTDADTVVPVHWVDEIISNFENQKLVGMGGLLKPLDGTLRDDVFFTVANSLYILSAAVKLYQFPGSNCAYRLDAYRKSSGFREDFKILDDLEFSARMGKFGKEKLNLKMTVRTSARRMNHRGYFHVMRQFARGYRNWWFNKTHHIEYLRDVPR